MKTFKTDWICTAKREAIVLEGEARPGSCRFLDIDGGQSTGREAIFPILRQESSGELQLIGTGFFICTSGLFVSAKHVLLDPFDDGKQIHAIGVFHFLPGDNFVSRNVVWCSSHDTADVAVGFLKPQHDEESGMILPNKVLTLTTSPPSIGEPIATYAYPKTTTTREGARQILNFAPSFYDGTVQTDLLPDGQGRVRGPCYRTNIWIHGGASGGPVVGRAGRVFAINSSSYDGQPDIPYISRVDEILHLRIPSIDLSDGQRVTNTTILELVRSGWIDIQPPL